MLSQQELNDLLTDLESDRVERTVSVNNTDKFSEAICAFSNDFPNHKQAGYLIIGVDDKNGKPTGLTVTDQLLKDLAAIRNNGQVLPQPSITIQKYSLHGGEVAVVEVFPSPSPPVRYKGRVWIRNGPTKAIANEAEELRLSEKRTASAKTYDATPAFDSNLGDLNLELFKTTYLPNSIDREILAANHRDIKQQLASLRLYDIVRDCPTHAGLLTLGNNPAFFIPGSYVQYVRFAGKGLESEILNEERFSGDILSLMQQLDMFVRNNIEQRPVAITALKEEIVKEYPYRAIRELLNNAIMHRNYESNAPVKFYEFSDRIEIANPGGLYGAARPDNFPHQNDYRNPIIAEAMKIMGYVNKFNRGIETAKQELAANGNPEPVFEYTLPLHFGVTIYKKVL
ncbi:RNA-binding domain-containing protein [Haliscomenobacter hydrossis]|uniref:Transcriptional regulator n=1 Tax=Haliscomenobacter hydrossis (strain ATCC 27775 / DSM 1100 / LMG 10767 / O) TaxID=760192 RepID=F4KTR7_HALH1|nr:RNA-binding domain-containing protein [Haliscomenobacter hydrossis]AEE48061.1 putative transcriptional regulator [Haliscomenobacter hydrossis DSM 1100]